METAKTFAELGDEMMTKVGRLLGAVADRLNHEGAEIVGAARRAFDQTKTITKEMLPAGKKGSSGQKAAKSPAEKASKTSAEKAAKSSPDKEPDDSETPAKKPTK